MVRFICHFLIVWLTLLSGGAHAIADATHEAGHTPAPVAIIQATNVSIGAASTFSQAAEDIDVASANGQTEACSLSHCGHGHATGLLPTVHTRLNDAPGNAALPVLQPWATGELPNSIERPKWVHTTSSVVNL